MGEVPERSGGDGGGAKRLMTIERFALLRSAPPSPLRGTSPMKNGGRELSNFLPLKRSLQRLYQIGFFPAKAAFFIGGAAKMAVGRGAGVDGFVEVKMGSYAARG